MTGMRLRIARNDTNGHTVTRRIGSATAVSLHAMAAIASTTPRAMRTVVVRLRSWTFKTDNNTKLVIITSNTPDAQATASTLVGHDRNSAPAHAAPRAS